MKRFMLTILALLLFAALAGPAVAADDTVEVQSAALVETTVVNQQGEKELVRQPATKVLPGEEVIFVNIYVNNGAESADAVVINNPIPEHMTYVGGSASGENTTVTYSVDGGQTFGPLLELTVTETDGSQRPAAAVDVTQIRWERTTPLAPGEEARVEFRARLQ